MTCIVYIDGKLKKLSAAEISELAPGTIAGKGMFETMAVYSGRVFAFGPHFVRLSRGLRLMGLSPQHSADFYRKKIGEVIKKNRLKDARARLTITERDGRLHTNIIAQPSTKPSNKAYQAGHKLYTSSYKLTKRKYSHVKNTDYGKFHSAHYEAVKCGFDEALLLDKKGRCVEAAYANIFIVSKGMLITPPVSSGCLNGITRNIILNLAAEIGIPRQTGNFRPTDILKADECFLTGSLIEVMPVASLDRRQIGHDLPGPLTQILAESYAQLIKAFRRSSR